MTETEREETCDYGARRVPAHARLPGQQGHHQGPPCPVAPPAWPSRRPRGEAAVPHLLAFRMGLTLEEMIEEIFNQKKEAGRGVPSRAGEPWALSTVTPTALTEDSLP